MTTPEEYVTYHVLHNSYTADGRARPPTLHSRGCYAVLSNLLLSVTSRETGTASKLKNICHLLYVQSFLIVRIWLPIKHIVMYKMSETKTVAIICAKI